MACEQRVADAMMADGWQILARNWRGGGSELDIVAIREGLIRIVEVKGRQDGDPLASVTPAKCRRLSRASRAFLAQWLGDFEEVAFAIALVDDEALTWLDNAFDAS